MGFLDSLLSKGAKKVLNNLVDEAADRISDAIGDKVGAKNDESVTDKLEQIFNSEYQEYTVKKDVNPTTIGGTGSFRPYTYGLYLNDQPKAFIMVTDHNKEQLRTFRWSKEEAEKNGIPFINFFTQFPNTPEYIKNRLAQYIK